MDELTPEWIFKKKIITGLHGNLDFQRKIFYLRVQVLFLNIYGQIREFININIHLTIIIVMKHH